MKLFKPLYEKTLVWAGHRYAEIYLATLSFVGDMVASLLPGVGGAHLAERIELLKAVKPTPERGR